MTVGTDYITSNALVCSRPWKNVSAWFFSRTIGSYWLVLQELALFHSSVIMFKHFKHDVKGLGSHMHLYTDMKGY